MDLPQTLSSLSREGFIPGPSEDEAAFLRRVQACRELAQSAPDWEHAESFPEALAQVVQLYDIRPSWVPLCYSNRGLPPWQGAAACFADVNEDTDVAWIQLRKGMRQRERLWGMYARNELIAHEMCHVGRMAFEEPKFEELLAYQTASSMRRHWAALIQTPAEALILIFSFLLPILVSILSLLFVPQLYILLLWVQLLPLLVILGFVVRLCLRRHQLTRCIRKLSSLLAAPLWLIYRLTDREIIQFGKMAPHVIQEYMRNQTSLRWQSLRATYTEVHIHR